MTPADAFRRYCAFKAHFNGSTNFFKYKKLKKIKYTTFNQRNDKVFFSRLAKEKKMDFLLLANLLEDKNRWIGEIVGENGKRTLDAWLPRIQNLSENFEADLSKITKQDILTTKIFGKCFDNEITLESMVILNSIFKLTERFKDEMDVKYLYSDQVDTIEKYQPFLEKVMDKDELKRIIKVKFFS